MSDNNSNDNIILKVEGLKKVFGDHVVLENINTTVKIFLFFWQSQYK